MKTNDTHDSVEEEVTTNIDFDTDVDGTNLLVEAKMTKMTQDLVETVMAMICWRKWR